MIGAGLPGVIEDCGDALSGALMNAGPIIHPPLILMNAAPLQHFERWDIHNEGTQPAVRAVTDRARRRTHRHARGAGLRRAAFPAGRPLRERPLDVRRRAQEAAPTAATGASTSTCTRTATCSRTPCWAWPSCPRWRAMPASMRRSRTACWRIVGAHPRPRSAPGPAHASTRSGLAALDARRSCRRCCTTGGLMTAAHRLRRRRPHGPRHRDRVRLRRHPRRPDRPEAAQRRRLGAAGATRPRPRCAAACSCWRSWARVPADAVRAHRRARRAWCATTEADAALAAADVVFEGVPETLEAKREALRPRLRRGAAPTRSSPPPPRPSWSPSWRRWCTQPERLLNMHWLNPAYVIPLVELSTHAGHRARRARARAQALLEGDRQAAGGLRPGARLHRAAPAGADHERGGAHGRRRRGHRRGHRQGHALRPGPALRGDRRGRVHRLRRRRHPAPRQPRDEPRARAPSATPRRPSSTG